MCALMKRKRIAICELSVTKAAREAENGSVGWDRTNDRPINSRMLYR